jgi:hypothetical protein
MEVLEVECIVPGLIVSVERESSVAALELNGNDRRSTDDHRVDSAPEARHIELEEDPAVETRQGIAENVDLLLPRTQLTLFQLDRIVRSCKVPEYRLWCSLDEGGRGGPVVCGGAAFPLL